MHGIITGLVTVVEIQDQYLGETTAMKMFTPTDDLNLDNVNDEGSSPEPPAWLRAWQSLNAEERERTKPYVNSIISIQMDLDRQGYGWEEEGLSQSLDMAKQLVGTGRSGDIASAIIDTIKSRMVDTEKQQKIREAMYRQWDLSRTAVRMLLIGIVVQGTILGVVFYFIGWSGKISAEILGVKTLSVVAVVIAAIAGSLARVVHESQSMSDSDLQSDIQTFAQMAATSVSRPILAAVLALFVFALFQCGLIGIPFETVEVLGDSVKFAREDFFFVAIAFVIGMNDTVGLNLLAFVGKYLPDSAAPINVDVAPTEKQAKP